MNRAKFVTEFAARMAAAGYPTTDRAAATAVEKFLETIEDAVALGDEVKFVGFGVFGTVERAERTGRNPKTGEAVTIPARHRVRFRAAAKFHDFVESQRETAAVLADPGAVADIAAAEVELAAA